MTQLTVQKLQETQNTEASYLDDAALKLQELQQQANRMGESISTQEQQQLLQRQQLRKHDRLIKNLVAAAEGVYQPAGGESALSEQLSESQDISQVWNACYACCACDGCHACDACDVCHGCHGCNGCNGCNDCHVGAASSRRWLTTRAVRCGPSLRVHCRVPADSASSPRPLCRSSPLS